MNCFKRMAFLMALFMPLLAFEQAQSQTLPVKYEELNTPQLVEAIGLSGGICVVPIGILEKHGPHLPLGTDLLDVREMVSRAVEKEYAVVFPPYYFGQIYEAKHQPGTMAYSPEVVWQLLDETCAELARNGFKKILLVNGHGGNSYFLPYFCQAQLEKEKDYCVVLFTPQEDSLTTEKIDKLRKTDMGGHAGEIETSMISAHRPDLAHTDQADKQSGEDQKRMDHLQNVYAGIWWYAKYPNHYAGDGSYASAEIGDLVLNSEAEQLARLLKQLKEDDTILNLQKQFFEQSQTPSKTEQ